MTANISRAKNRPDRGIDGRYRRAKTLPQLRDPVRPQGHRGSADPQEFIVTTLLADLEVDAFSEGEVSNQYLRDNDAKDVTGGLAPAGVDPIDGLTETFNFIVRNASAGCSTG
jgi:hypothetical protein